MLISFRATGARCAIILIPLKINVSLNVKCRLLFQTFRNKKLGHFHPWFTPPNIKCFGYTPARYFNKPIIPFTEPLTGQLWSCTALPAKIHKPFIHMVQMWYGSQFAKKRAGKIPIYVLNITLKHKYLSAEIVENQDVPIFRGFDWEKSGRLADMLFTLQNKHKFNIWSKPNIFI